MFRPKKTIPKLAVAMLALTGCGGEGGNGGGGTGGNGMGGAGGDGTGGAGGTGSGNFDASLAAFCMNAAPCFGYAVQECTNYYNNVMPMYYDIDSGCEAALISYFDCGAPKSCNELLAGACDAEYDAVFYEHCTPLQ